MDIMRIFDALNDVRNMRCAIEATKRAGGHAQGTICYTKSPVHSIENFVKMGVELEDMGCESICIKDMAGLIPPYVAAEMVRGLKKAVRIPVWLHTHDTAAWAPVPTWQPSRPGSTPSTCRSSPLPTARASPTAPAC
jgi:pyruvate/oxaloacetate carboxyltransferase